MRNTMITITTLADVIVRALRELPTEGEVAGG